jgi:hypothetical protein
MHHQAGSAKPSSMASCSCKAHAPCIEDTRKDSTLLYGLIDEISSLDQRRTYSSLSL